MNYILTAKVELQYIIIHYNFLTKQLLFHES